MAFDIFITLPVSLIFVGNGFFHLFYSLQLRKRFPKAHNFLNSLSIVFLWILAAIAYPLFYTANDPYIKWFQGLSSFLIAFVTPCLIFLILLYQYLQVNKNPEIKTRRKEIIDIKDSNESTISITNSRKKMLYIDINRKLLHLFPASLIISLWIYAVEIWEDVMFQNEIWGISGENFGRFLIITIGYSGILIFAAMDYIRLSYIFNRRNLTYLIPDNVLNLLNKSMKSNEKIEFIRSASMVLSFVPIFFFPFEIFATTVLISTISDGAASISGLKWGKYHFPKNSTKTVTGHIAGFIVSYIICFITFIIFKPLVDMSGLSLVSLVGALTFVLIDILNLRIDDNILNPILCGLLIWFSTQLFL